MHSFCRFASSTFEASDLKSFWKMQPAVQSKHWVSRNGTQIPSQISSISGLSEELTWWEKRGSSDVYGARRGPISVPIFHIPPYLFISGRSRECYPPNRRLIARRCSKRNFRNSGSKLFIRWSIWTFALESALFSKNWDQTLTKTFPHQFVLW